ncbi:MarR family transcriptional regulator [Rheinheimera sp.]|uniref:MarR family winged helix-turn-helix transcriptional regulator n=1 Tax=Rheinheimera sp. TaxID=1869214 RepID=UPI00307E0851
MTTDALYPLDSQLCFSVYGLSIAINRTYKPLLDKLGLTYPQYLVMSALWEDDGLTVSGIGVRLSLESSTITPLVKRLEVMGLVLRRRGTQDERQVFVDLTATGRAVREKTGCLAKALAVHSGMEPSELENLNNQVCKLRDALSEALL